MVRSVGKDPGMIRKATCQHCALILEYYPRDVKSETHSDYGGGTDTYYHIICPDCDHQVRVRNL